MRMQRLDVDDLMGEDIVQAEEDCWKSMRQRLDAEYIDVETDEEVPDAEETVTE